MNKLSRRSFLRRSLPGGNLALPGGIAPAGGVSAETVLEGTSRRAFIQGTAGAAAGAAMIVATPRVASIALDGKGQAVAGEPRPVVTEPSGPAPYEPVTAYVRDARSGEVTVMSGKSETTYRDPVLVKRLLDAAR